MNDRPDDTEAAHVGLRRLDYRHLKAFEAIYSNRNISRAGQLLGLSQPAISSLLGRLRDVLQDQLFVRRARGVEPTPRADEMIGAVRTAIEAFEAITEPRTTFDPRNDTREFRIHMVDLVEPIVMPHLVDEALRGPGISYRLLLAAKIPVTDALESGEADLAIGLPPPHRNELRWEPLLPVDLILVARKDHPALADGFTPDMLLKLNYVNLDMTPGALANSQNFHLAQRFERRDVVRVSRVSSILDIAATTDLVGFANRQHVQASPLRDHLMVIDLPVPINNQLFHMTWHKRSEDDPGLDWIKSQVRTAVLKTNANGVQSATQPGAKPDEAS